MLRHLLKLIWKRKTANSLIMAEIAVTFVILFSLFAVTKHYYQLYQQPLGYQWQNNWSIHIGYNNSPNQQDKINTLRQLVSALEAHPKITSVGLTRSPMLDSGNWTSFTYLNQQRIDFNLIEVSPHTPKDWGVELIAGNWFYPQTTALDHLPVMVNQAMVEQMAATQNHSFEPIGALIPFHDNKEKPPRKIVGVIKDLRQHGELVATKPLILYPYDLHNAQQVLAYIHISYTLPPTLSQQEALAKLLLNIAPQWTFSQTSWRSLRQNLLNDAIVPLTLSATIVGFLLIMVAMGLFGVLWQSIARRTYELGLRRALGASKASIQFQLILELLILSAISMIIAMVLILPFILFIEQLNWNNLLFSLSMAAFTIIITVLLCALYPSRLATKTPPAIALHED